MQQYANLFTTASLECRNEALTACQLDRLYDLVGSTEIANVVLRYGAVIAGGAALYVADERQGKGGVADVDVFVLGGGLDSDRGERAAIETFHELARRLGALCDSPGYAITPSHATREVRHGDEVERSEDEVGISRPLRVLYRVGCMLTIHARGRPVIQLIYSSAKTVEALISGFDFDVVQCTLYRDDGGSNRLVRTVYAVAALETRTIAHILDYVYNSMRFTSRLKKLHRKGFRLPGTYERVDELLTTYRPASRDGWMDAKDLKVFIVGAWEEQPWTTETRVAFYDDTSRSRCGKGSSHPMRGERYSTVQDALDSCRLQVFSREGYEGTDGRVSAEGSNLRFVRLVSCLDERTDAQLKEEDVRVSRVARSVPTSLEKEAAALRELRKRDEMAVTGSRLGAVRELVDRYLDC
jgi:hypothetical protein